MLGRIIALCLLFFLANYFSYWYSDAHEFSKSTNSSIIELFVSLEHENSLGVGVYIHKNIILTAKHVIEGKPLEKFRYSRATDGQSLNVKVIDTVESEVSDAIFLILQNPLDSQGVEVTPLSKQMVRHQLTNDDSVKSVRPHQKNSNIT